MVTPGDVVFSVRCVARVFVFPVDNFPSPLRRDLSSSCHFCCSLNRCGSEQQLGFVEHPRGVAGV